MNSPKIKKLYQMAFEKNKNPSEIEDPLAGQKITASKKMETIRLKIEQDFE